MSIEVGTMVAQQWKSIEDSIFIACEELKELHDEVAAREFDVDEKGEPEVHEVSVLRDIRNQKIIELANLVHEQENLMRGTIKLANGETMGRA